MEYSETASSAAKAGTAGARSVRMMPADWLGTFATKLIESGVRVIAPVEIGGVVQFGPVTDASRIVTDQLNTVVPLKEVVFPCSEVLLTFKEQKGDVNFAPVARDAVPTVVLGCRPCDAAAVDRLTTVFTWDYDDELYMSRLRDTTFVTLACTSPDANCFCSSVGLGPADASGSDILVQETGAGLHVSVITEKGEKLVTEHARSAGDEQNAESPNAGPAPAVQFDIAQIRQWLDDNFDSELWTDPGLQCMGCGVCSFMCPTCHCFDIVDEAEWDHGERRRNWDSCAFSLFTLHTSGHNPRPDQKARYRQRVMHKFKYFPERFNQTGCVGCGRCIRQCPAGLNLVGILQQMK